VGIEEEVRGAAEATNVISMPHTGIEMTFVAAVAFEPDRR
jgi:hypothetical protein